MTSSHVNPSNSLNEKQVNCSLSMNTNNIITIIKTFYKNKIDFKVIKTSKIFAKSFKQSLVILSFS